jgi:NADH dehydrogenase (ubiquinone) Fe-S protein 8
MASMKPFAMLARGTSAATLLRSPQFASGRFPSPATVAFFSTTFRRAATPAGPPPPGFRLPPPKRWDEGEGSLDRAGRYFLLMEMFRGMYVSLEQYFRPP